MAKKKGEDTIAVNRRARFDYEIADTFEAGLVLTGTEVKSLRGGKASLAEAYGMVRDGEAFLMQATIPEYAFGNRANHDPTRPRKLLLHRREIEAMERFTQERGRTIVPMRLYWRDGNAKLQVGLGTGKATYDKRHALAERDAQRQVRRALRDRERAQPSVIAYGDGEDQVGDLWVPDGPAPWPVAVLLHGGYWRARWGRDLMDGLAADLAARGFAAWNLEYRRVGAGGGWPATFDDVAAGLDAVADLDGVDPGRVAVVGHSAGGHLALWLASRTRASAPGSWSRWRPWPTCPSRTGSGSATTRRPSCWAGRRRRSRTATGRRPRRPWCRWGSGRFWYTAPPTRTSRSPSAAPTTRQLSPRATTAPSSNSPASTT